MRGTRRRAMRRRSSTQVMTAMSPPFHARIARSGRVLVSCAMVATAAGPVMLGPVPVDFILFALILAGIAFFHHKTFEIAVGGLIVITIYKVVFTGFQYGPGLGG